MIKNQPSKEQLMIALQKYRDDFNASKRQNTHRIDEYTITQDSPPGVGFVLESTLHGPKWCLRSVEEAKAAIPRHRSRYAS